MMGWYHDGGMGTGGWIVMLTMMAAFWALVVLAGVLIFRGTSSSRDAKDGRSADKSSYRDPMDILDERFAHGELDSDEYEARRAVLRRSGR